MNPFPLASLVLPQLWGKLGYYLSYEVSRNYLSCEVSRKNWEKEVLLVFNINNIKRRKVKVIAFQLIARVEKWSYLVEVVFDQRRVSSEDTPQKMKELKNKILCCNSVSDFHLVLSFYLKGNPHFYSCPGNQTIWITGSLGAPLEPNFLLEALRVYGLRLLRPMGTHAEWHFSVTDQQTKRF